MASKLFSRKLNAPSNGGDAEDTWKKALSGAFHLSNMGFLNIFIASQLLILGRGMPQSREDAHGSGNKPECRDTNAIPVTAKPNTDYVFDCNCTLPGGHPGHYPEETPCWKEDFGYNKEYSMEEGRCKNGYCVLLDITRGCKEMEPKMHQQKVDQTNAPTGCTFRCQNPKTRALEYGYYAPGVPCWHTAERDRVLGTCRQVGEEVLCMTKPHGC